MDAKPYPKDQQLARGERRYRRKVASPKQWQAIIAADNIVPLHAFCHGQLHTAFGPVADIGRLGLLAALSDAEYAYMIERGGEDYPERAYGVSYGR